MFPSHHISKLTLLIATAGEELAYNYGTIHSFVLQLTMLCTRVNSALTTTIIGTMKNVFLAYIGVLLGGDYVYSGVNFIGITLSVLAGVLYALVSS